MGLDNLRRSANRPRLDHVRIKRALHQPIDVAFGLRDAMRLFVENGNEFAANDLALGLRIGDAGKPRQKSLGRVNGDDVQSKFVS